MTQFLADIELLMVDEHIRSAMSKLPDALVEQAEELSPSLFSIITESDVAANVMVYYAIHGKFLNSFLNF